MKALRPSPRGTFLGNALRFANSSGAILIPTP